MSVFALMGRYRLRFLFTLLLVLLDAALLVFFPLFIGKAISGAIAESYQEVIQLGLLGMATLLVGSLRRFYDSRFYARVYEQMGAKIGDNEATPVSTQSAHLGFLTEVVEFFENQLPELVNSAIGLIGTLIMIAVLNGTVFLGCGLVMLIVFTVYALSSKPTAQLHQGYSAELEKQVTVLSGHQPMLLRNHLSKLMRWNVRLSDRETFNFAIVWFFMMLFLTLAIVIIVQQGITNYGEVFSLVLYLFQFMEVAIVLPLFYQQWLRLKTIVSRLEVI